MSNMSAVETLQAIRAGFAALQADLDATNRLQEKMTAERDNAIEKIHVLNKNLDIAFGRIVQLENDLRELVAVRDARIKTLQAELEAARRWVPVGESCRKRTRLLLHTTIKKSKLAKRLSVRTEIGTGIPGTQLES